MKTLGHFLEGELRRATVSIGALLLVCCSTRAGEIVDSFAPDRRSPWKITGDFHYAIHPPSQAKDGRPAVDSAEILTLEKLVVIRHNGARILENLFADQARHHAEEAFSWEKGGIIHESANKRVVTKWIYKEDFHTIDLLSFPW
jgi:hypothetical protein